MSGDKQSRQHTTVSGGGVGQFGRQNADPGLSFSEQIVFPVDPITQEAARLADELTRHYPGRTPNAFQRAAVEHASTLAQTLADPGRQLAIASVTSALDTVSDGARVVVFFSAGETGLVGQAVAQFAGWNIPGVGEIEQLKRPRTRIYDTFDPDTLLQVKASLDFDRAALVFVPDANAPETTAIQAEVFVPALVEAIGRERAADRILGIIPAAQGPAASERLTAQGRLVAVIERAGGRVLKLAQSTTPTPVPVALCPAAFAPGFARGVDLNRVDAGVSTVLDRLASSQHQPQAPNGFDSPPQPSDQQTHRRNSVGTPDQVHLGWSALIGAVRGQDRRTDRATHVTVLTTADRMARLVAWTAAHLTAPDLQIFVAAVPQSVLGQGGCALGINLADGALAHLDAASTTATPGPMLRPMLCLVDVARPEVPNPALQTSSSSDNELADTLWRSAEIWSDRLAANAVAQGRVVRRVVSSLNSPEAYGQFVARVLIDRQLFEPATALAD